MIKKIAGSIMFFSLIIAIPLAVMGITRVELGLPFQAFIRQVAIDSQSFGIKIPDIPKIEIDENTASILRSIISIVNNIVSFLNFIVVFLNAIISILLFLFTLIRNTIYLISNLATTHVVAVQIGII